MTSFGMGEAPAAARPASSPRRIPMNSHGLHHPLREWRGRGHEAPVVRCAPAHTGQERSRVGLGMPFEAFLQDDLARTAPRAGLFTSAWPQRRPYFEGAFAAGPASVPGLAVAPGAPAATLPPCIWLFAPCVLSFSFWAAVLG